MKKSVTKTVCLLLSVLMLLSGLPMLTPSVSAATVVGENAVYTYGAKSDMMKIADYSDADYQAAKALLQPSEDLKALLDSGVGSEQAPFVVKNFHQLRLLFFWMNFRSIIFFVGFDVSDIGLS